MSNDGKLDLSLFIDILRTLEWNSGSQSRLQRGQKRGGRMVSRRNANNRPTGWLRPDLATRPMDQKIGVRIPVPE